MNDIPKSWHYEARKRGLTDEDIDKILIENNIYTREKLDDLYSKKDLFSRMGYSRVYRDMTIGKAIRFLEQQEEIARQKQIAKQRKKLIDRTFMMGGILLGQALANPRSKQKQKKMNDFFKEMRKELQKWKG